MGDQEPVKGECENCHDTDWLIGGQCADCVLAETLGMLKTAQSNLDACAVNIRLIRGYLAS